MKFAKKGSTGEIFIYEDIGAGFFGGIGAKDFAAELKKLGAVDTIVLRINSYGGEVFDGLAIYNQLVQHSARVVTHIDGIAASIASIIAMAGDEIIIAEAGFLMIHNAWTVAMGNAKDMRQQADVLDQLDSSLLDVYTARTGKPRDTIAAWMNDEKWFDGAEAVTEGFASSTMPVMQAVARFDENKHKFVNAPRALSVPAVPRPVRDNLAARLGAVSADIAIQRMKQTRGAGR